MPKKFSHALPLWNGEKREIIVSFLKPSFSVVIDLKHTISFWVGQTNPTHRHFFSFFAKNNMRTNANFIIFQAKYMKIGPYLWFSLPNILIMIKIILGELLKSDRSIFLKNSCLPNSVQNTFRRIFEYLDSNYDHKN